MDRTRKLLLALAAAAVAATLLALRGWIAPATARWVLLALLGWYWVRFIVLPVDVIKRTKVLNAFAVTWWVNSFPILPAVTGAVRLWSGAPFERRAVPEQDGAGHGGCGDRCCSSSSSRRWRDT